MAADKEALARKVLADTYIMSLGVADENGPWVADVVFINPEGFEVCWISSTGKRHSKAILANGRAAATITASDEQGQERGLQLAGTARPVEATPALLNLMHTKYGLSDKDIAALQAPAVSDKMLWRLTPDTVMLLDSAHFGWEQVRVV